MTGRALLLTAPRQLRWVREELPPIGPHDLLIETRAGAVSIGAELPQYRGDARSSTPMSYPRMTGYESLGIVLARGASVRDVQVGARVVAFYGHRTHAVIPADRVIIVPTAVSDELALLAILTAVSGKLDRMISMCCTPSMPRAYSLDLRERALRALDAGLAAVEIERTFGISARTVRRWNARRANGASLAPGTSPGRPPAIAPELHDALRAQIAAHPDATLAEHCALWRAAHDGSVSIASLARALAKLGITLKKSPARGGTG